MEKNYEISKLAIMFFMIAFVSCLNVKADDFVIEFMNTPSIKIGDKAMKKGDKFNSSQPIYWTDDRQILKVKDRKGKIYKITRRGFLVMEKNRNSKIRSLADFLQKEQYLGSRSDSKQYRHYTEEEFYLLDSLHFKAYNSPSPNISAEAYWFYNGKEVATPLKRTPDNAYYVVELGVFKDKSPQDIRLSIRETNSQIDWVNTVYSDIPIVFIPQILK